jgi:hypothetical protein
MQRARESADAAAAAAAVATVAPLLQLTRAAKKAEDLARFSRALELYERALAAAELSQPRDSLIIAALLDKLDMMHQDSYEQGLEGNTPNLNAIAAGNVVLVRSFHLLHARWQAGTLFRPTAEEVAYLVEDEHPALPAQMCGALFYISVAKNVAQQHLLPANSEARLQGVYGALRAALEMDARGMPERHPRTGQAWSALPGRASCAVPVVKMVARRFVAYALSDEAGLLLRLRAACGLTATEETALRQLAERYKATAERAQQELPKLTERANARQQHAAAADVARHGLRRCALPSCNVQEPHPKLFKLCGRCRSAAYCCAQHSKEDWKRHKREDGCAAAP